MLRYIDGSRVVYWDDALSNLTVPSTVRAAYLTGNIVANGFVINTSSIKLGSNAGNINQGTRAVALGTNAGYSNQGATAVAIGDYAGSSNQGIQAVAIGANAGLLTQGQAATAIGRNAGSSNQTLNAVAIGSFAGQEGQKVAAIAIGNNAGATSQGDYGVSIGSFAGNSLQGRDSVAIGDYAGYQAQSENCVAMGHFAGFDQQGLNSIALGWQTGEYSAGENSIALGYNTSRYFAGAASIAIGSNTGQFQQSPAGIFIGTEAGASADNFGGSQTVALGIRAAYDNIYDNTIAIGYYAGYTVAGTDTISIGANAGQTGKGTESIAVGTYAGTSDQGTTTIAIGYAAGSNSQGAGGIAIGSNAGVSAQGAQAIAIGTGSGGTQGSNAIAIGPGTTGVANSIVLNASSISLSGATAGLYLNPVRQGTDKSFPLFYNTITKQLTYGVIDVPVIKDRYTLTIAQGDYTRTINSVPFFNRRRIKTSDIYVAVTPYTNTDMILTFGQTIAPRWVVLGDSSPAAQTISYSPNGIQWYGLGNTLFSQNGLKAQWNGTMWIANGQGTNMYIYSFDGIQWQSLPITSPTNTSSNIYWNGRIWIALLNQSYMWYSYDGINWTQNTSILRTLNAAKWNGYIWIAGGARTTDGTMIYSYDGINWAPITSNPFNNIGSTVNAIEYNGRMWVAAGGYITGSTTNSLAYSYDGFTWIGLGITVFNAVGRGLAWNGKMWVAVGGYDGNGSSIGYSYDGINWVGLGSTLFFYGSSVAWDGTKWVAVGAGNTPNTTQSTYYSFNGIDWISAGANLPINSRGFGIAFNSNRPHQIRIPRNILVAGGSGTNPAAFSVDQGITWITSTSGSALFTSWNNVAWNGRAWVACGSGTSHTLAYSTDGVTWTGLGTTIFSSEAYDVTWTGSYWIAVGNSGIVARSADGRSWLSSTLSFTATAVMYAFNNVYVSGNTGYYALSGDQGLTWAVVLLNPDIGGGIGYNGKRMIFVGGNTFIFYTDDGTTFKTAKTTIFTNMECIAWNGSYWLLGGAGTAPLAYSTNGIAWTAVSMGGVLTQVNDVAWVGSRWIAVGTGPSFRAATSPDGLTWTGISLTQFSSGGRCISNTNSLGSVYIQHPAIVAAQGFSGTLTYNWTNNEPLATSFTLTITGGTVSTSVIVPSTVTSYTFTGLTVGTTYNATVTANIGGSSSTPVSFAAASPTF